MISYNRDKDLYITNRALELTDDPNGYSESEIAKIISEEIGLAVTRNVVHGRVYRQRRSSGLEMKPRIYMPYFEKYADYYVESRLAEPKVNYDFSVGPLKILVVNDLHMPFQHEAALEQALVENKSADVVVTSEVADMYSLTSFAKYMHVPFEREVEEIIRWFEYLNENFPITYVVNSGHDRRLPRYILSRIRSDLLFLVETDLLRRLAKPFERVVTVPKRWVPINDALFTHLDKHSATIPMRGVVHSYEWVRNWGHDFDIPKFRLMAQAHGHHSGIVNLPNVQLVETGCLQQTPEWVLNKMPKLPWVRGWTIVYQNDGVTNLNETKVVVYRKE